MPIYNIEDSKFVVETISIVFDFSKELGPTDLITGIPVIGVTLLTGLDLNPSLMLYEGISIKDGKVVEQRFQKGIPGCIYSISFTVKTVGGFEYAQDTFLAVLPSAGTATPLFNPLYFTSNLYPYDYIELIQNSISILSGNLLENPHWQENLQNTFLPLYGSLAGSITYYYIPHEDIQNSITPISGTLVGGQVIYTIPHEDIKVSIAFISGTLSGTQVSYSNPHEDMQVTLTPVSGTLT